MSNRLCTLSLAAVILMGPFICAARSQALPEEQMEQTPIFSGANWEFTLGFGVGDGPTFQGSSHYRVHPITLGSASYRNISFLGPTGLGANLLNVKGLRAGPILGYQGGRRENADPHLAGLGNIQASVEAGMFASWQFGPIELNGTVRQAITHSNNGGFGRVQLEYRLPMLRERLDLRLGPEADFGDIRYASTWFGVSDVQSAKSHLPEFGPQGGMTAAGAYVILDYHLSPHFILRTFGNVREISGDSGRSPIVEERRQAFVGIGLAYHWPAVTVSTSHP